MEKIKLQRTGDAPLVFDGEILAESDGYMVAGKDQNRWHDIRIYRTASGNYVLEIVYNTKWEGELGHKFATQVNREGVVEELRSYNPIATLQGFPKAPHYADRQANLEAWLQQRWENQIGEILAEIDEFSDRIE